ncbi:neural cell adhesion molecule 2-like [Arctopsyche grandis]|uniref:neural cell adhesion molecule 2-like n=1 Tax=Arctopsyche grandis TaxID=121162 RepID=UPI00406D90CA
MSETSVLKFRGETFVDSRSESETTSALGVTGGGARLSCSLGTSTAVQLAIWYKEGHEQPVYTWDSRGRSPEHARHWAAPLLGGRAHFSPPAALVLTNLRGEDNGVYRCRIDFHKSPTRNTRVNLTVIIPPHRVEIQDDLKRPIQGKTRAYREGDPVKLYCIPHGGDPPASVSWWRGGALLSKSSFLEILADRSSLSEPLTCQATNNNLTVPLSAAVHMDLILKPLSVRIQGPKRSFSANKSTEIMCQTVGARPKPSVSWWKGSTRLKSTRESTSIDGNVTTSILSFTPQLEDAGKYLSCKAIQTNLQEPGLEDGWKLEIHHVPIVNLFLGSSLNAAGIIEGTDVYFECNIKANPWVYKIQWFHEGELLQSSPQEGVIISNQSLVLQSLKKSRSGIYTCLATNEEGEGRSNKLLLDVKFRPYCRKGQQVVYNIARNEEAKISCELLANPQESVRFMWKFNNSELLSTVLPTSKIVAYNTGNNMITRNDAFVPGYSYATSVASYTPKNSSDYGTLMCIGTNSVGTQFMPCVFHIVPAGKPDPLSNCTVNNQTTDVLQINCVEGFDGGLPQRFIVQVYNTQNNFLMKNATFDTPQFDFTHLPSDAYFNIDVYAYNKKGMSEVFTMQTHTLKEPEKRTSKFILIYFADCLK